MNGERPSHRIRRSVLEIQFPKSHDQAAFQKRISQLFWQRIKPLIEEVCDEFSPAGQIDRIKKIDVDLGQLPLHSLEDFDEARFKALFKKQLKAQVSRFIIEPVTSSSTNYREYAGQQASERGSIAGGVVLDKPLQRNAAAGGNSLDTIRYFLTTGLLPWWEDLQQYGSLDECLRQALKHHPEALKHSFSSWLDYDGVLTRLAAQFSDQLLIDFLVVMNPNAISESQMRDSIREIDSFQGKSQKYRSIWWRSVLELVGSEQTGSSTQLSLKIRNLYHDIESKFRSIDTNADGSNKVKPKESSQGQPLIEDELVRGVVKPGKPEGEDKLSTDEQSKSTGNADRLDPIAKKDRPGKEQSASTEADELQADWSEEQPSWKHKVHIEQLPDQFSDENETARQSKEEVDPLPQGKEQETSEPKAATSAQGPAYTRVPPFHLKQEESIYIMDSGLVILWPFLSRFFEEAGLLVDDKFISFEAQNRAVYLLYGLATGQAQAPEYALPLNKLLCGIPIQYPILEQPELSEEDLSLCVQLIEAVVAQVPVLNNMSVDGMRGSFLLRDGALKLKNQQWTLYAKQETFDVVLDRLPWPFKFVKLPWMESMLYVEW